MTPIDPTVAINVTATVTPLEGETIEQQNMIVRAVTKSIEPHYTHSDTTKRIAPLTTHMPNPLPNMARVS